MKENIDLVEIAMLIHPLPLDDQKTLPKKGKTIPAKKAIDSVKLDHLISKEAK